MSTDEGASREDKRPLSLRERQSDIKKKLESTIASKEKLYSLISFPLFLLQIKLPNHLAKHAIWDDQNEKDKKLAQAGTIWISEIQRLLLEKVLIDWKDEIEKDLPSILEAWFAPLVENTSAIAAINGGKSSINSGSIYVATLSTLSAILSSASIKFSRAQSSSQNTPLELAFPPEAVLLVNKVLLLFTANFSLCSIVQNLQAYQSSTKRDIIWSKVVRELTSLPERVANATKGRGPQALERRHFVKIIGRQVEELSFSNCSPDLTATLLVKLVRNGYFDETSSETDEPITIWPAFLRNYLARGNMKGNFGWLSALQAAPISIKTAIALSLASFVDRFSLRRSQSFLLLNGDELRKAGTEGKRFLDVEAWARALEVASIVELLLVFKDKTTDGEEDTSDSEEDEDKPAHLLCQTILPSSTGYWSPLMARMLVHLISANSNQETVLNILTKTINLWSTSSRIKTAMWEQEVYLTTLILLLVAQLPSSSIASLCTLSTFINGISTHLEHMSSRVRRMGMLVAETVSTASGAPKTLSFGRSIWEGKGEGKEECRVLRAMFHGWKNRQMDSDQPTLSALGLSASVALVIGEYIISPIYPRKTPKTRSLPVKKSAPARSKPLIESLDHDDAIQKDDQADSLPSLTNIQLTKGPSVAYVSDKESSSSEEGSSDSENQDDETVPPGKEKKQEFGLGIPHKKKQRPPVYIHELAPLFREQEREGNKLALKHAEILIKKKTGWGGEVEENAVNLALTILSFQNNFNFKNFEEKKKSAMTSLVFASPHLVAPCLVEQYFGQQYSMAQRICILHALAFGARQLSIDGQKSKQANLKTLAEEFSHKAIIRSRVEGEKRMPKLQQDQSLLLKFKPEPRCLDGGNLQMIKKNNSYLSLAGPSFIFPLVNRFWAHLDHANSTRDRRYRGSGSTILFDSFLVGAFLDTLAILCFCGQNSVNFLTEIVPGVMNLALTITNTALARAAQGDVSEQGGGPSSILGASSSLFLLLLDAVCELDSGRFLLRRHAELITQVETWAGALFESIEGHGGADRAARCTAALLLRINEMKQSNQH